jgi:Flp pilus assembly protein TadD
MRDLASRLARLGDAARAERVHTNMVEMMANESESHQALAEVRSEQRRFADAASEWRQVIRVRSKEPTGYLGLAKALLAAGDRKAAREPLEQLIAGTWEPRFGDVKAEARALLRQLGPD